MKPSIILLVGMALAIPTISICQPGTVWTATISNIDVVTQIVPFITEDGEFIIATAGNSGELTRTDFQLIKTDSIGQVIWRRFYSAIPDRPSSEVISGACRMPDGGFVMVGDGILRTDSEFNSVWFRSRYETSGYNCVPAHDGNIIVIGRNQPRKLSDENGAEIWRREYQNVGGSLSSILDDCLQTEDGGYIFAGSTARIGAGSQDMYVGKADEDGNLQWEQTYGTEVYEFCNVIIPVSNDGWLIGGASRYGNFSDQNAMMVRINAEGDIIWQHIYDEFDRGDYIVDIVTTCDGGFAAFGGRENFFTTFILRIDCNGEIMWRWNSGRWWSNDARAMFYLDDSSYLLVGYNGGEAIIIRTTPDPLCLHPIAYRHNYGEVRTDSAALWELQVVNTWWFREDIDSISIDSEFDVFSVDTSFHQPHRIAPGDTTTIPLLFSPHAEGEYQGYVSVWYGDDVHRFRFVANISGRGVPPNAVALEPEPHPIFLSSYVSPNPFNSMTTINFDLPEQSEVKLAVFDLGGRAVAALLSGSTQPGHHTLAWDGAACNTGLYLVRLEADGKVFTSKALLIK